MLLILAAGYQYCAPGNNYFLLFLINLLTICAHRVKSTKLAFAFELLDDDKDGYLTKRGLWKLFRSFLRALSCLNLDLKNLSVKQATTICDGTAIKTAAKLCSELSRGKSGLLTGVSFQNLADWYSDGAYVSTMWLELLDLNKWMQLKRKEARQRHIVPAENADSRHISKAKFRSKAEPSAEVDSRIIFHCKIISSENATSQEQCPVSLVLSAVDSSYVSAVVSAGGFSALDPQNLVQTLSNYSKDGNSISKEAFTEFIGVLVSHQTQSHVRAPPHPTQPPTYLR